jgi:hypothetical protein
MTSLPGIRHGKRSDGDAECPGRLKSEKVVITMALKPDHRQDSLKLHAAVMILQQFFSMLRKRLARWVEARQ